MISEVIFDVFLMGLCAKLPYEKHKFIVVFIVGGTTAFSKKNEKNMFFLQFSGHFFRKGRQLRFFIDLGSILAPIFDQLGGKSRKKGGRKIDEILRDSGIIPGTPPGTVNEGVEG